MSDSELLSYQDLVDQARSYEKKAKHDIRFALGSAALGGSMVTAGALAFAEGGPLNAINGIIGLTVGSFMAYTSLKEAQSSLENSQTATEYHLMAKDA